MRFAFLGILVCSSAFAAGDSLVSQLTGPSGKSGWVAGGGTCRRPDVTFARSGMGLTIRFSHSDTEGSAASFSTAEAEGEPSRFTLRFSRLDPETFVNKPQSYAAALDGGRLTLTDSEGARRVYTRCDGDAPARTWEME